MYEEYIRKKNNRIADEKKCIRKMYEFRYGTF